MQTDTKRSDRSRAPISYISQFVVFITAIANILIVLVLILIVRAFISGSVERSLRGLHRLIISIGLPENEVDRIVGVSMYAVVMIFVIFILPLALVFGLYNLVIVWMLRRNYQYIMQRRLRVCYHCGYDVRALHRPICPECGRDGSDITVYKLAGTTPWWMLVGFRMKAPPEERPVPRELALALGDPIRATRWAWVELIKSDRDWRRRTRARLAALTRALWRVFVRLVRSCVWVLRPLVWLTRRAWRGARWYAQWRERLPRLIGPRRAR